MLEKIKGLQAILAYPNGWTCVNCGDEYTEKTIDAHAIHTTFMHIHTEIHGFN
jgi:hypothetical protein